MNMQMFGIWLLINLIVSIGVSLFHGEEKIEQFYRLFISELIAIIIFLIIYGANDG